MGLLGRLSSSRAPTAGTQRSDSYIFRRSDLLTGCQCRPRGEGGGHHKNICFELQARFIHCPIGLRSGESHRRRGNASPGEIDCYVCIATYPPPHPPPLPHTPHPTSSRSRGRLYAIAFMNTAMAHVERILIDIWRCQGPFRTRNVRLNTMK